MAMVGLFWVTPDAVYVGSPPAADGGCVRLSADGLESRDPEGSRTWAWDGLRSAVVADVPAEGRAGRAPKFLGSMVSAALGAFLGEGPPEMTLRLGTEYGPQELKVYSAAAGGYGAEEAALSQDLLARFVAGTADPRVVEAWGRAHGLEGTPKPREREALLRAWAQG
ncbi:hypothetical protein BGK67_03170 [Streptomyces subrutilus]|uniref:Uncharacterized protein n=1 Tax=Streptomyces subrutilus TaxID=36818 RepID=A0A1E5PLQ3_9ACTN|nr:hypothetical protein BGK67_03170 [Streptomyces subrutilus]